MRDAASKAVHKFSSALVTFLGAVITYLTEAAYGRLYFGSLVEGTVHHGGQAWCHETEASDHISATIRKQRGAQFTSSFPSGPAPQPQDGDTHLYGQSSHLYKANVSTKSQISPEARLLGDS